MTAATSSQLLWYTTRATGVVAMVLLTGSVVLGVLTTVRFSTSGWPRFTFQDLHRRVSLLAVVFVGFHVLTTVTDAFAPIGWLAVFVPFTSPYRRLWLGLGTVALDLLLAVTVSSLLRHRISQRTWRALHWLSYGSWPLAVVHGLGTGTDPHLEWMVLLVVACVATVLIAIGWRLVVGWPARAGTRVTVAATTSVAVIALAVWTVTGPLRPGWAARAGTPANLLAGRHKSGPASVATSATTSTTAAPSSALPSPPYHAAFAGTIAQQQLSNSLVQIDVSARTSGPLPALLSLTIVGQPDGSGGVTMQQGEATFGPVGSPGDYRGQIVGLEGARVQLALADAAGNRLDLRMDMNISGSQVEGELTSLDTAAGGRDLP